jgi:hypothetical protein
VPGAPESGIHGHDLTLGTGSYDGILGGQTSLRYKNLFFEAETQSTLRGDGAHQYHFANDLVSVVVPVPIFYAAATRLSAFSVPVPENTKTLIAFVEEQPKTPHHIRFSRTASSGFGGRTQWRTGCRDSGLDR